MPFFPEQEPGDPVDTADALSESSPNIYGQWEIWYGNDNTVEIDFSNVVVRNGSVHIHNHVPYGSTMDVGAAFVFLTPIDMSNWELMRFYLAGKNARDSPSEWNLPLSEHQVFLVDINNKFASVQIAFRTLDGNYDPKELSLSYFTVEPGFDWTQVIAWVFYFICINVNPFTWYGFDIWIDAGPFIYRAPVSYEVLFKAFEDGKEIARNITVTNNSTGETFTYATPFQVSLTQENGTTYTLEADANRFSAWEDGTINPIRQFTPIENRIVNPIIAYYTPYIQYNLTVKSIPGGKLVLIGGTQFNTGDEGVTVAVSPGNYTIEVVDKFGFIRWEPGGETESKIILYIDKDTTITAVYEEFIFGGLPASLLWTILPFAFLGITVASIKIIKSR